MMQDAVCRRLEVIGESVKNIPIHIRDQFPKIPWRDIAGLRDIISHAYFNIVSKRIWKVIENDLLPLKQEIDEVKQYVLKMEE